MRGTDRVPGPSRWLCPQCAFDLYDRMSPLDDAAHRVHHRQAHHRDARLRGLALTRSEVGDYVGDLEAYVHELEARASRYRGEIAELTDAVSELQEALAAAGAAEYAADAEDEP